MEFSNLFFLYLFFPFCAAVYFLAPGMKLKNGVLILFSLLFYTLSCPVYLPVLLFLAGGNYLLTKVWAGKKCCMWIGQSFNIGTLLLFKLLPGIPFPLGLSFYVFSLISYQADVYRNPDERSCSFLKFLLFVSFFPKLVMGPILRYSQISVQLETGNVDPKGIFKGILRFTVGLSKKILMADPLFRVYEQLGTHSSCLSPWLGAAAFMLYIYLEFSGYGDMALGMSHIFGFDLPENFDRPYTSASVSLFWRRWHITLGTFFRDYVYIPLGGSRRGSFRQSGNLFAVWLLTGLWHGFSWTFMIWGMYFYVVLLLEKHTLTIRKQIPVVLQRLFTFILVYFGWIIFASGSVSELGKTLGQMFSFSARSLEPTLLVLQNSGPVLLVSFVLSVPGPVWKKKLKTKSENSSAISARLLPVALCLTVLLLLGLCTVALLGGAARPSMYAGF